MTAKKCIYKAQDCKDGDEHDFLSPCFELNTDVQLKEVPTTGEEYLLTVIKERAKCSVVTKCRDDYSRFAKNQSCFVEELPHVEVPDKLKPTTEWQNIQVADFSDIRMYISRLLAKKSSWPKNLMNIEMEQNNLIGWKNFFAKREPTLTCVLGLKHALIDKGLEILTEILDDVKPGDTLDHKTGQWIYAFLACTSQPLLSDTTSILRGLARKCAQIRSHINPDHDGAVSAVAPLNIFICIVAQYFRQYDLTD